MGGISQAEVVKRWNSRLLPRLGVDPETLAGLRREPAHLKGRAIVLRPLTQEDESAWQELVEVNRDELAGSGFSSESDSFIELLAANTTSEVFDVGYSFGIFRDDRLVGEAELTGLVRGSVESAFLSLWVDRDARGDGIAEEAYVLLIGHAFEGLGLHRVEAAVLPGNRAVERALEKVGVEPRGTEPAYLRIGGEWRDHVRYVITAEEWERSGRELREAFL